MTPLPAAALLALSRIAEHRARRPANDIEVRAIREEVRSYAVDVCNALLREWPELGEGHGCIEGGRER